MAGLVGPRAGLGIAGLVACQCARLARDAELAGESDAVIRHDASAQFGRIAAPAQVTFGRRDLMCSTRFADRLTRGIVGAELMVFKDCAHAPIYRT